MGVVAVRMVMTETLDEEGKPTLPRSPAGSALLPLLGIIGVTVGRAFGWIQLNDPLTRGLVFIPLFILLLIRLHKQTLANQAAPAGVTGILSHPALSFLGAISFPIFIVHGALGQLFFKKARLFFLGNEPKSTRFRHCCFRRRSSPDRAAWAEGNTASSLFH